MEQLGFFDLPSPCVGVCKTDKRGYCLGCLRSRDERFYWQQYTETQKLAVIRLCKRRYRNRQLASSKSEEKPPFVNPNTSFDFGDSN